MGGLDVFEGERFFVELGLDALTFVFPGSDVGEILIVPLGFPIRRLECEASGPVAGGVFYGSVTVIPVAPAR